jgi:hypothetical protein
MAALIEAMSDGFGARLQRDAVPEPIPTGLNGGLLEHQFYRAGHDAEDGDGFFVGGEDDAPSPAECFPLEFHPRRLRVYFQNQYDRFCVTYRCELEAWQRSEFQEQSPISMLEYDFHASALIYQKPWYEYHALQFLDWIEGRVLGLSSSAYRALTSFANPLFAGQLGRLVEQYYWRFRFEGAAITGVGVRSGVSAGGKARAITHRAMQDAWQQTAREIWGRRPELSRTAVAQLVKSQLNLQSTAKHIARYISPKK